MSVRVTPDPAREGPEVADEGFYSKDLPPDERPHPLKSSDGWTRVLRLMTAAKNEPDPAAWRERWASVLISVALGADRRLTGTAATRLMHLVHAMAAGPPQRTTGRFRHALQAENDADLFGHEGVTTSADARRLLRAQEEAMLLWRKRQAGEAAPTLSARERKRMDDAIGQRIKRAEAVLGMKLARAATSSRPDRNPPKS